MRLLPLLGCPIRISYFSGKTVSFFWARLQRNLISIRLFFYTAISASYFAFMRSHAPLGITWRAFHEQRVFNAVNHIVNGSPLLAYGLTSWNPFGAFAKSLASGQLVEAYLVSALPHWLHSVVDSLFGFDELVTIGVVGDYLLISLVALLSAEITAQIVITKSRSLDILWPSVTFVLFLSSPWSYRMMLAPWHEVSWLFFVLLSYYCWLKGRVKLGLLFMFAGGLYHWQWSFVMFLFYGFVWIAGFAPHQNSLRLLYPPGLRNSHRSLTVIAASVAPALIYFAQFKFLSLSSLNVSHSGSNLLFRIGIDNGENIHHGGLLAALQFLGGNRLSLCMQGAQIQPLKSIAMFNCLTAISGWALLALIGSAGFLLACYRYGEMRWLLAPIIWSFSTFLLIFQQSFAVHLQGYSFVFGFIFSFGLVYLLATLDKKLKLSPVACVLIHLPIVAGVVINAIRVNYLTGVAG